MIELPIIGVGVVVDRLVPGDAAALARSHSDLENARFQGWQSPLDVDEAERFIEANESLAAFTPDVGAQLAIRQVLGGPMIGDLYAHRTAEDAETLTVGITLDRGMQGRGYALAAVEAVIAMIEADAGSGISRIVAVVDADNASSLRLFRRAGFTESERLHRTSVRRDGSIGDEVVLTRQTH